MRRRFSRWAQTVNLWPKLEIGLAIMALGIGATTYFVLSGNEAPLKSGTPHLMTALVVLNLIPLMGLAVLVARRLLILLADRRRGLAGARLHIRLIALFSLVAVIPTLLVVIFASLLFEFGLQFWFSDRVKTVLDNADQVAQAYVLENKERIRGDILAMSWDLARQAPQLSRDRRAFDDVVHWQALARDLSEAIVFKVSPDRRMDVLARARLDPNVSTAGLPGEVVAEAAKGQVVVLEGQGEDNNRVQALIKLEPYSNSFLYVSRKVAPQVLNQVARTKSALSDYRALVQRRKALELRFNIALVAASLIILVVAIWAAIWLANRLAAPIARLVRAAERVGRGDMSARVPVRGSPDELGVLARTFNRMTLQLEGQTNALMSANDQLDMRRRFTEAVLSGVSAGVLGVSTDGVISLPNRSAAVLLEVDRSELVGRTLQEVAPEFQELFDTAKNNLDSISRGQVSIRRGLVSRTFMAQVSPETGGDHEGGFVITFDDITQQLADQRQAAWSDVARRIAHEIKNPLTPIQLSAERLKRKYLKEVSSDPETFQACTDTIIRQVGDLRRMVDEFSSFARMPKPVFRPEPLVDIIRQALFLQEIGHPEISFSLSVPDAEQIMVCDRRQIGQAATNLIKNAVEATLAQRQAGEVTTAGAIEISLTITDGWLSIKVADNGIGFPKDLKARLTEPYVTTRAKGTGLGLAIVKKIVEDHGGELILSDRPQGGALAEMRFNLIALAPLGDNDNQTTSNPESKLQVKHGA